MSMDLYRTALDLLERERRFAFAAVIHSTGSTPQKAGAKALFEATGAVHGTLGGGCLEAEARRRALHGLDTDAAEAFELRLDAIDGWDDGLVCGGKVRLFSDPSPERNAAVWHSMLTAADHGTRGVLVTVAKAPGHVPGTAFWIPDDRLESAPPGLDAGMLDEAIRGGDACAVQVDDAEYFLEPVSPPPRLIVAGAGHIGKAVTALAAGLGFEVTVVDDRPLFANAENLPGARRVVCGDIAEELGKQGIDRNTYVLVVTRGHRHDGDALAAVVNADAAFIGMIGSRRKSLLIRREIVDRGIAPADAVERVVSPVGLDLGARTVEEIAMSIAAQLVAVRRRGTLAAESLRLPMDSDAGVPLPGAVDV